MRDTRGQIILTDLKSIVQERILGEKKAPPKQKKK